MRSDKKNEGARLRPAGPIIVTRVRPPPVTQTAQITVLFADLRGYTGMAERLPAVRVVPPHGLCLEEVRYPAAGRLAARATLTRRVRVTQDTGG